MFDELLEKAETALLEKRYDDAEKLYCTVLDIAPDDPKILHQLGTLYASRKRNGLAINLLANSIRSSGGHINTWTVLGAAFKAENRPNDARACWEEGLKLGETPELLSNMATLYSDSGDPERALPYVRRSLELDPTNPHSHWNQALALLSKREWATAWDEAEWRRKLPTYNARSFGGIPEWDGSRCNVVVSGEQGIGDEILFLSCLPDLIGRVENVYVECTPRLVPIVERSFGVRAFPSESDFMDSGVQADMHIPLGTLPKHFRRSFESFPGTAYLKPDPGLVGHYRARLETLGKGPYIGLSWIGGSKNTRMLDRSLPLRVLAPIYERFTCVSVQYSDLAEKACSEVGLPHWPEAAGNREYEHALALVAALDAVVAVLTTVIHAAGSIGKPCYVLTPKRPTWPFATQFQTMPWYSSIRLVRQQDEGEWDSVVKQVVGRLADFS